MKKIIIACAVLTFGMVSCKKNYSCTCTNSGVDYYDSDGDGVDEAHPFSYSESFKIEKANKTQAKAACNEAKITQQNGQDTDEYSCDLSK